MCSLSHEKRGCARNCKIIFKLIFGHSRPDDYIGVAGPRKILRKYELRVYDCQIMCGRTSEVYDTMTDRQYDRQAFSPYCGSPPGKENAQSPALHSSPSTVYYSARCELYTMTCEFSSPRMISIPLSSSYSHCCAKV